MAVIAHAADLHLSQTEEPYSMAVLDEICVICLRAGATLLLLAGDVFDTFDAADAMRAVVRGRLARLSGRCVVLMIPGNHDHLRAGSRRLEALDLGNLTLLSRLPASLHTARIQTADSPLQLEILAVPHQESYEALTTWAVPPRNGDLRIALAHAVVPGVTYDPAAVFGDVESGGGVLDAGFFLRAQVDYAALGHIHSRRRVRLGDTELAYPGSARVWRKGEAGPRGINLLHLERTGDRPAVRVEEVALASAGEYRRVTVPLGLGGELDLDAWESAGWGAQDWVHIVLTGVVEDEHEAARQEQRLQASFAPRLRRLEVDRDELTVLPGIAGEPLARRFLDALERRKPAGDGPELEVWLRARQMGLLEIKRALEARR